MKINFFIHGDNLVKALDAIITDGDCWKWGSWVMDWELPFLPEEGDSFDWMCFMEKLPLDGSNENCEAFRQVEDLSAHTKVYWRQWRKEDGEIYMNCFLGLKEDFQDLLDAPKKLDEIKHTNISEFLNKCSLMDSESRIENILSEYIKVYGNIPIESVTKQNFRKIRNAGMQSWIMFKDMRENYLQQNGKHKYSSEI